MKNRRVGLVAVGSVCAPHQAVQDSVLPLCVATNVLEEGKLIPVPAGHQDGVFSCFSLGICQAIKQEDAPRSCTSLLTLYPVVAPVGRSWMSQSGTRTTSPGAGDDPTSATLSFKLVSVWFRPPFSHTRMLQCWDNSGPQVPSPLMQRKVCRGS